MSTPKQNFIKLNKQLGYSLQKDVYYRNNIIHFNVIITRPQYKIWSDDIKTKIRIVSRKLFHDAKTKL